MGEPVDVHVLHCYEPHEWIDACLRSLENEPVNVHLCEGIKGKVGRARARAFRNGHAPYVAFVDADDEVYPGAFEAALNVLEARPEVVGTYCNLTVMNHESVDYDAYDKGGWDPRRQLQHSSEVHHLHVIRRPAVEYWLEELAKWDGFEEWVLCGLICKFGTHHHIPRRLYRFRQHGNYPRAGAIGWRSLHRAALRTITPYLAPLIAAGTMQGRD